MGGCCEKSRGTAAVRVGWDELGGAELEPVLLSGAIALLDAHWLIRLAGAGGVPHPRQCLPPEAFLSADEVATSAIRGLPIVCVSHAWCTPHHPDPDGESLRALARTLKLLEAQSSQHCSPCRHAVFYDFCSLHQRCRDSGGEPLLAGGSGWYPSEEALHRRALCHISALYSHPQTWVFLLNTKASAETFLSRGWCYCEALWAMSGKRPGMVLDISRDSGAAADWFDFVDECRTLSCRAAPVTPDVFAAQLEEKCFSHGEVRLGLCFARLAAVTLPMTPSPLLIGPATRRSVVPHRLRGSLCRSDAPRVPRSGLGRRGGQDPGRHARVGRRTAVALSLPRRQRPRLRGDSLHCRGDAVGPAAGAPARGQLYSR